MQDDTTAAPTAIAIARNYAELVDAFRKRCHELGAAMEQLDEIAGLPARYVSKLLAPVSVKAFGPISLGPLLGSLGVKLVMVEDPEAFARVKRRLVRSAHAGSKMLARRNRHGGFQMWRGNPDLARKIRMRQILKQTPQQRRRTAKHAAMIRWSEVKRTSALPPIATG
jgi:hypothetical protein